MEKLMSTSGGGVPNPIIEAAAIGFIEARPKPSVAMDAANQANIPRLIIILSVQEQLDTREKNTEKFVPNSFAHSKGGLIF